MARRRNQGSIWPIVMVGMGLALIVGAIGWYFLNSGDSSSASVSTAPTAEVKIPYPDVQRISLADAKAAYDTKTAVFVDVRGEPYYSQGHIPGALSITDVELPNRLNELNPSDWIITYCTWPSEESSARGAQVLLENGFTKVTPIKGGLEAWVAAGYPVEP